MAREPTDHQLTTGSILGDLRVDGWAVFDDVRWPGRPRANIDHVVVGPPGVFVLEVEVRPGQVDLLGDALWCDGLRQDDTVAAVGEAALVVEMMIGAAAAGSVRPVVCFDRPEPLTGRCHDVEVCSSATLGDLLRSRPTQLTPDQVRLATLELDAAARQAREQYIVRHPAAGRQRPSEPTPTAPRSRTSVARIALRVAMVAVVALSAIDQVPRFAALAVRTLGPRDPVPAYASCRDLRGDYRNGVGTQDAVAQLARPAAQTRARPTVEPEVYDANAGLDTDGDGIACER